MERGELNSNPPLLTAGLTIVLLTQISVVGGKMRHNDAEEGNASGLRESADDLANLFVTREEARKSKADLDARTASIAERFAKDFDDARKGAERQIEELEKRRDRELAEIESRRADIQEKVSAAERRFKERLKGLSEDASKKTVEMLILAFEKATGAPPTVVVHDKLPTVVRVPQSLTPPPSQVGKVHHRPTVTADADLVRKTIARV